MTKLIKDVVGDTIQAVGLPVTGRTATIAVASGNNVSSGSFSGLHYIVPTVDIRACTGSADASGDLFMPANIPQYFALNGKFTAHCTSAGNVYLSEV